MKVKLAHEHPYSEKTKREKWGGNLSARSDSREGRDPEGPKRVEEHIEFKSPGF